MKHKNFFIIKAILLSLGFVLLSAYIIPIGAASEFDMTKTLLLYMILLLTVLFWAIAIAYKANAAATTEIAQKYDNIVRVLMDVRDGTKYFYREKRRSLRAKADLLARFVDKSAGDDFVKISDISFKGAQLRTVRALKVGETVKLNIYLPFFSQPINVRARIVRARPTTDLKGTSAILQAGADFTDISDEDTAKLVETIKILSRMPRKKRVL